MEDTNHLDVLEGDETSTIWATRIRPNSSIALELNIRCSPYGTTTDRLDRSWLTLNYSPEGSEATEFLIQGWDIAMLLDGIDQLRPELLLRIKDAERVADREGKAALDRLERGRREASPRGKAPAGSKAARKIRA